MKIPRAAPVGSVIAYDYLWDSESKRRVDGAKTRPSVVVLAVQHKGNSQIVYCLGISHSAPQSLQRAMLIPTKLLRHLGLETSPSWVYTDQLNVFVWPGPDLRPASWLSTRADIQDGCVIGHLPGDWFETLTSHLDESRRMGRMAVLKREE